MSRTTCQRCQNSMEPKLQYIAGKPAASHCPYCGETFMLTTHGEKKLREQRILRVIFPVFIFVVVFVISAMAIHLLRA